MLVANSLLAIAQKSKVKRSTPKPAISAVKAPTNPACSDFVKLADIISADNLKTLVTTGYESKYYNSDNLFLSSVNIPDALESFINDDSDFGASYHCFLKNYGSDDATAKADFEGIVKQFGACLKKKEISKGSELDTYIFYKKCKIEIHTFKNYNIGAWVLSISMEYSNY